ncbi:carbohydrate ABC transporter permease [Actinoplanes sp. NPDC051411]|uniref:carbohydrate ABC transporter permease n=1 Tax=Actinoplanes sp. NPDC051411 TaxID=3155522 RepID=UPI003432A549
MRRSSRVVLGTVSILASVVVFVIPFAFIVLQAAKTASEASQLKFSWPGKVVFLDNIRSVLTTQDYIVVIAFINSVVLTVASVAVLVVLCAMVAFVLQRRVTRATPLLNFLVLASLIVPPAVVPTIWVLQGVHLFGTLPGLILVEVAFGISFCTLLFRAFIGTIPRQLDEAALLDGASPLRLFFRVILPLLRPVMVTVIVVQSVAVFNDFTNPLYFLPGSQGATVQLTLFNFQSQYNTSFNLLFADILLITVPPLIMYLFFNRQIVAGLTSGAVKG